MEPALAWLAAAELAPVVSVPAARDGPGTVEVHRAAGVRYDGLLGVTPAGSLVAVDLLGGADARASSLRAQVPRGAAIARQSALWVHTGRMRPGRLAVVVPAHRRVQAQAVVHRQSLAGDDVIHLAGVPTTSPVRTAVDLLCYSPARQAVPGVRLLLAGAVSVDSVERALTVASGLPTRRARDLLVIVLEGGR